MQEVEALTAAVQDDEAEIAGELELARARAAAQRVVCPLPDAERHRRALARDVVPLEHGLLEDEHRPGPRRPSAHERSRAARAPGVQHAAHSLRPSEVGDEVRLPGLAAVLGERLLPPRRRRRHARPGVADEDRPSLEGVRPLEDPDVAGERADDRRIERAGVPAVRPVDRPELRLGIEEAERHADVAAGVVGQEHVLVAHPAEDRPSDALRLELVPLLAACEPFPQAPVAAVPASHPEVEIPRGALCDHGRLAHRRPPRPVVTCLRHAIGEIGQIPPAICA